jgi:RimJ/RimL family protein N-acetyltransferase
VNQEWLVARELVGPRLTLTPLAEEDASDYLGALGDPDSARRVTEHLSVGVPAHLDDVRSLIAEAVAAPDRLAYAQRLTATGEFVGTTSFYDINPGLRAIAIGHTWIAERFWRTGVNTESKLLMLTRAFDGLGAERVVWHTDIRNLRSQAAIERLGAVREGVLRHHRIRRDGSWRDTVQYSMLAGEWPEARGRLEAALGSTGPAGIPDEREDRP